MKLYLLIILVSLFIFSCAEDPVEKCTKKEDCAKGEICSADGKCVKESISDCTVSGCQGDEVCNTETKKCEAKQVEDCTVSGCQGDEVCNTETKKCEAKQVEEGGLIINELMAKNSKYTDFVDSDWVEIYNSSASDIDLADYYLCDNNYADNVENCTKILKDPTTIVTAKGFILFYFDELLDKGPLHINAKLGKTEDSVYLISPEGNVIDSVSYNAETALNENISYGRLNQGDEWSKFEGDKVTPKAVNPESL